MAALGLPRGADESYHVHAPLSVYRDGEQVEVPAHIAFNTRVCGRSSLHTHTPDGVVHVGTEADDPHPYQLS